MTRQVALLGLALLTIFILGSFYLQLTEAPSRTQTARLDPYGAINVHLETDPDPPKTGGIPLVVHITNQNGTAVAVDRAQYEYALGDRKSRTVSGESTGDGAFTAVAALTDVGEWQVRVTLFKGSRQTQVAFKLRVGANI